MLNPVSRGGATPRLRLVALSCLGLVALVLGVVSAQVHALTPGKGTFSVSLTTIVDDGSADFSGDTFTVRYTCWRADGTSEATGALNVPGNGTAVTSPEIAAGLECDIRPDMGSAWKAGYEVGSSVSDQTVNVIDGQDAPVAFSLTYERSYGSLYVSKISDYGPFILPPPPQGDFPQQDHVLPEACKGGVTASGLLVVGPACGSAAGWRHPAEPAGFQATNVALTGSVTVRYSCTVPGEAAPRTGSKEIAVNTGPVEVVEVPSGTECTVTEDAASAYRPGYALATNYSETTVTVYDWDRYVTVYNNYTALVLDSGLTISKTVEGSGASLAPEEFTVDYACTDAAGVPTVSGSVALSAGSSKTVEVPAGSCTVTERDASVEGAELATTMTVGDVSVAGTSTSVAVSSDAGAAVSVTNTYTRAQSETPSVAPTEPTAAPSATASAAPRRPLARTGVSVELPLVLVAAALAGGVLLAHRRRS